MQRSQFVRNKAPIPLQLSSYQQSVRVKAGDRFIFAGTSGSGKTWAMKAIDRHLGSLYPTHRHYFFDSKDQGDFDEYPGRISGNSCPRKPWGNAMYQVWHPILLIPEEIEKWLDSIMHDAPAIVLVDELVHLRYKANLYSPKYEEMQKTGRSKKIITLTGTQELGKIPGNAYKQASHRFGFYIDKAAQYDRMVLNLLLKEKVENPRDEWGFYYQSEKGRGDPLYFSTIQQFLGKGSS